MATALSQYEYDFYIISDDAKVWEENVIQELKKRRKGIRCTSSRDSIPGKFRVRNLIEPIEKSQKVIIGFTSESHTAGETEFITSHVIQEMMNDNQFGKLIPVKITHDAVIPDSLKGVTVANGWEDTIYEKLFEPLDDENKTPATGDGNQQRGEKKIHRNEEDVNTEHNCTIHVARQLEFFCKTCQRFSCADCTDHVRCNQNEHDVITMKIAVDEFNENVAEVVKITEEIKDKLNEKRDFMNEEKKIFETYLDLSRQAIDFQLKCIIQGVKKESRKIMKDLDEISKEKKEKFGNQSRDIDDLQIQVNEKLLSINKMINSPQQTKKLQSINQTINALSDNIDQSFQRRNITPHFVPSKHLNDVINTEGIGKIIMNEKTYQVAKEDESFKITKDQSFEVKVSSLVKSKQCELAATLMNSSGKTSATEIEDQENGEYRIKSKCDEEGEWQMKITVDDVHIKGSPVNIKVEKIGLVKTIGNTSEYKEHNKRDKIIDVMLDKDGCILVGNAREDLLKFNQSGLFVERIQVSQDVRINKMHKMSNNHMVYSDYKKQVVMCDEKYNKVSSFGKAILKYPTGLTVNETTRILYVADHEAHCVFKFNIDDGRLLGTIGREGSEPGQMKNPTDVTLTDNGQVIVADFGNNRIQIFDASDNFIKTIIGRGKEDGNVWGPGGITIDAEENMLITSNHKLQLFDKNGVFIKRIDDEDDGLNVPAGTCILSNRPRKVAVANHGKNNIKIFNY